MKEESVHVCVHQEPTEIIVVHNYPPSCGTYSYATRLIKETWEVSDSNKGKSILVKYEMGDPVYLHESTHGIDLAMCNAGINQNYLNKLLPMPEEWIHEKYR